MNAYDAASLWMTHLKAVAVLHQDVEAGQSLWPIWWSQEPAARLHACTAPHTATQLVQLRKTIPAGKQAGRHRIEEGYVECMATVLVPQKMDAPDSACMLLGISSPPWGPLR